jgi:hypothetical protein
VRLFHWLLLAREMPRKPERSGHSSGLVKIL